MQSALSRIVGVVLLLSVYSCTGLIVCSVGRQLLHRSPTATRLWEKAPADPPEKGSFQSATAKPFGTKEYWNSFYKDGTEDFSWYSGWDDLEPFLTEWLEPDFRILLPGVGSDPLLTDLYDNGYTKLTAFDYAPESIEHCRRMLGPVRSADVDLQVADARTVPYADQAFDMVVDKGTLDAVSLIGNSESERRENLERALSEMHRVLKPGGIFWSVSAICVDALLELLKQQQQEQQKSADTAEWEVLTDGSFFVTQDGYTSNNVDGTLLVYRKMG